jgi:hypothetical protein
LHDAIAVEKLGVPAVGVMTTKFVSAADLMARVLGADGYHYVAIEHPISSATPVDLDAEAKRTIDEGLLILAGKGGERQQTSADA